MVDGDGSDYDDVLEIGSTLDSFGNQRHLEQKKIIVQKRIAGPQFYTSKD